MSEAYIPSHEGLIDSNRVLNEIDPYKSAAWLCSNVLDQKKRIAAIISSCLLMIISTGLNIQYGNSVFDTSLTFQADLQSAAPSSFLQFFMNIISNAVNPNVVIIAVIVLFAISNKKMSVLNFLVFFAFASYFCQILKTLFASPRPYWIGSTVQDWEWVCYQEFGNPSGHSFLGPILYEFILNNYLLRKISPQKAAIRITVTFLTILLIALVMFCRLYLGMHAINQVAYGFAMGMALLILYRFAFEQLIQQLLLFLLRKNIEKSNRIQISAWITVLFCIAVAIPTVIFAIQNKDQQLQIEEQPWRIEILNKCKLEKLDALKIFENKCFIDSSTICLIFAFLYSFLFSKYPGYIMGTFTPNSQILNRIFITLIGSLTCVGGFMMIPTSKVVPMKFLYQSLGIFGTGLSLLHLIPYLLIRLKLCLLDEEAQRKLEESERLRSPTDFSDSSPDYRNSIRKSTEQGARFSINSEQPEQTSSSLKNNSRNPRLDNY